MNIIKSFCIPFRISTLLIGLGTTVLNQCSIGNIVTVYN